MSGRPGAIAAAGVVVPAHDEEALLPACLAALRRAAGALHVPVHLLVVADACTDGTAAVARAGEPGSSASGPATWAPRGRPGWENCCG